ncbi:MAG TPA: phosphoenolpyruvate carboxylase, partial [Novosphingobium sp.]|nr:phosphoenolpyruvate carboxylase [Novosphingobium sp.]
MTSAAHLSARLASLHERTAETPLFNPVFQLSLELSRAIESGALGLDDAGALVAELECDSLQSRAARLARLLDPVAPAANHAAIRALCDRSEDFAALAERWQRPYLHVVFTAHPTFLLTPAQADAVAAAAASGAISSATVCAVDAPRPAITLDHEHDEAMAAMARAQDARDAIAALVLEQAAARFPGEWRTLRPMPFRMATWVGYDMDGRTDIGWSTSLRYRLKEKALRLGRYAARLEALVPGHALVARLRGAEAHAATLRDRFAADLLSADHPDRLTSLAPLIAALEAEAQGAPDDLARGLLVLACAMRADGLGMGGIHFRVNSSQLHNAIRRRIDPEDRLDLGSRTALARMRELLATVQPLRSNLAALAIEN